MAQLTSNNQRAIDDLRELVFKHHPEERIVNAIHRMTIRYSESMEARRYRRAMWQLDAVVRLSRALYRFGQR